ELSERLRYVGCVEFQVEHQILGVVNRKADGDAANSGVCARFREAVKCLLPELVVGDRVLDPERGHRGFSVTSPCLLLHCTLGAPPGRAVSRLSGGRRLPAKAGKRRTPAPGVRSLRGRYLGAGPRPRAHSGRRRGTSRCQEPAHAGLAAVREVIDFDAYVWLLTDPVTTVGAAPLADVPCLPELPALIKAKYATPVNRWTALQLRSSPAGTLRDAIARDLKRSLMWSQVLCRYGIGDVASAVFADQFGCWGFLDLWRNDTGGPFSTADAGFLAAVAGPLAAALRQCQARTFVDPAAQHRHDLGPVR